MLSSRFRLNTFQIPHPSFLIRSRGYEGVLARNQWLAADRPAHVPDPAGTSGAADLLRRLSDERRAAFALTQVLGLSYLEAAEVEGVPVGTIRSRVARARADLVDAVADALAS